MNNLKLNDIIEVKIEKLSYGINSIARYGEEKFVIFVENGVIGDFLKVQITSLNKKFAHAKIIEILNPSKDRIKPFCALYNPCGSCNYQNMEYDFLIQQKQIVLEDIFSDMIDKNQILPIIKSPDIYEYRHKIQYPIRQTKNSKRILMGYFKKNSHELINIKFCPIQPKIINEISNFIRENYKLSCYEEKKHAGLLKNVLFRISQNKEDILITLVLNSTEDDFENNYKYYFIDFFDVLSSNFKEIKGCLVNFNPKKTNNILGNKTQLIKGEHFIIETLGDKKYKISSSSFFQINPSCAIKLFEYIKENIKPNSSILDAYGGVGAIGIFLKEKASKITLLEENKEAVENAKENFKLNNISNYEILSGDAMEHILNLNKEKKKFDYIILDPPRSGCEKEGLKAISNIANNIIYVSCNPQTQKRDLKILFEDNFKLKSIQGVDLFPYTYHIESVAILEKQ